MECLYKIASGATLRILRRSGLELRAANEYLAEPRKMVGFQVGIEVFDKCNGVAIAERLI